MKVVGIRILPDDRSMLIVEHDPGELVAGNDGVSDISNEVNRHQGLVDSFLSIKDKIRQN